MKKIFIFFFLMILFCPFSVFAKKDDTITLYFFHGDGCPHCAEEEVLLDKLRNEYSNFSIQEYEVWYNEDNADLLFKVQEAMGIESLGVPTTIIGDYATVGYTDSSASKIRRAIEYFQKEEYVDVVSHIIDDSFQKEDYKKSGFIEQEEKTDTDMTMNVPIVGNVNLKKVSLTTAAVIIGLIDGFNPCAMWILLFLISVLIGMKNRKRMWALGLAFLFTSAFVYLLIMLSWIKIAVQFTTIIWVRSLIAWVALIGGVIQLRSFFKSNESGCEVVDDKKRKNIFKKIRKFTAEKSFLLALLGVIGLAISVNLVELACSAGLPLIFTELLALNKISDVAKFGYVLLYILFFLIDDLVVFFIAMFTMKVTGITSKYNKYSHLLGGIVMLLIGVLLLFKPEWLMFQFK